MKKLILLSACLLALAARPVMAQTSGPGIVVVRVTDSYNSINLVITRGEGKSETVEFPSGETDKRLTATGEGYYKVFSKLYQEGYVLQSTFTNGGYTTLLFTKKP